jgi:hypothetical protein
VELHRKPHDFAAEGTPLVAMNACPKRLDPTDANDPMSAKRQPTRSNVDIGSTISRSARRRSFRGFAFLRRWGTCAVRAEVGWAKLVDR